MKALTFGASCLVSAAALAAAGCSSGTSGGSAASSAPAGGRLDAATAAHPALPGYEVSVFARETTAYSHPDSVAIDGSHIYIGYQNVTAKDGSDHKASTVVEYSFEGEAGKTFTVPGHTDGMRVDPSTHLVWTTSNEDGNAAFNVIDPSSGLVTAYALPPAPHGAPTMICYSSAAEPSSWRQLPPSTPAATTSSRQSTKSRSVAARHR